MSPWLTVEYRATQWAAFFSFLCFSNYFSLPGSPDQVSAVASGDLKRAVRVGGGCSTQEGLFIRGDI